jgi:hypothetical protein
MEKGDGNPILKPGKKTNKHGKLPHDFTHKLFMQDFGQDDKQKTGE